MSRSARIVSFFSLFFIFTFCVFTTPTVTHADTNSGEDVQGGNLFGAFKTSATDCDKHNADEREKWLIDKSKTSLYDCITTYKKVSDSIQGVTNQVWGSTDARMYRAGEKGAIFAFATMGDSLINNPPASGLAYTRYMLANAGIVPKAYAQGIGFVGLLPIFPLWAAFRNLAYSILIIVMVIIGFMVIFRMKIDPKTIISIQAAIPKIIVTLLLVTFSYPIAGFLIDFMYLSMALMIGLIANALPKTPGVFDGYMTNAADLQTLFITGGWGALWASVFNFGLIGSFFKQTFGGSGFNSGLGLLATVLSSGIGGSFAAAGAGIFSAAAIPGLLIGAAAPVAILLLIIALGLLFTVIRITFILLNAYIQIIISVILSPILLLQEAIPGRSAFGQWIQNMLANLIVFPATVLVIYGSWILTSFAWKSNMWSPPLTPIGGGNDAGGGNPLAILLGLGLIFMTPNLIAQIKKAFHPSSALPLSSGSAFSPITGGVSTGMGAMSQFYYMQQLMGSHGNEGPLRQLLGKFIPGMGSKGEHGKSASS